MNGPLDSMPFVCTTTCAGGLFLRGVSVVWFCMLFWCKWGCCASARNLSLLLPVVFLLSVFVTELGLFHSSQCRSQIAVRFATFSVPGCIWWPHTQAIGLLLRWDSGQKSLQGKRLGVSHGEGPPAFSFLEAQGLPEQICASRPPNSQGGLCTHFWPKIEE